MKQARMLAAMLIFTSLTGCTVNEETTYTDAEGRIDCPGVDGTYYFAMIPLGECAYQGVSLLDEGTPVQDGGSFKPANGCSQDVTYDGCSIARVLTCSDEMTIEITQSFAPGAPNTVSGTQIQSMPGTISCEYEIFGSTDHAAVLEYADLDAGTDASGLSTSGTPHPENLSTVRDQCLVNVQAEQQTCPVDTDGTTDENWYVDNCVSDWQSLDAAGCGDAWLAYVDCRTENASDLSCDTGENPKCDVYINAYFQCTSDFTASTACSVAGSAETLCADVGGTYSYGCLGDSAPFSGCTPVETGGAAMYCCF